MKGPEEPLGPDPAPQQGAAVPWAAWGPYLLLEKGSAGRGRDRRTG